MSCPDSIKYTIPEAIHLRDNGMSLPEIAAAMGMTHNEVRSTLRRAMRKLRLKTIARELTAEDFYDTERSRKTNNG